jgi:hypothetical protein
MDCAECLASDTEWVEIEGEGELLYYSFVHCGQSGFEDKIPYVLGLAKFDEQVRILGLLKKDISETEINVGPKAGVVPVQLTPDRVSYELRKIQR